MHVGASTSAFAEVYREHHTYVWRTLRCMSVVDSALDDATQDVFMVVYRRLPEFEGRAAVRTWLFEIVRRVASRYRTHASKDAARTFELPELAGAADLEDEVAQAMAREILRAFLDGLDEDRLRVFVLAEIWQLKGREIADELGINQNTAYARLQSARAELDRLVTRLRAREASGVIATMRRSRPSRAAKARTWRALVVGLGLPSSMPIAVATSWTAGLAWGLVGGLAGATIVVGTAAVLPEPAARTMRAELEPARAPVGETAIDAAPPPAIETRAIEMPVMSEPAPRPARVERGVAKASAPVAIETPEPASPLSAEVQLVQAIRAAVAGDRVTAAREQIFHYRETYPRGALLPEVESLAVELRCRTTPVNAAMDIDAFARRFPGSTLVSRLRTVCEIGPRKRSGPKTQPS
jgi:RNA polymerase sigma-70 factor (ECF subfamily)